jgi:transposase
MLSYVINNVWLTGIVKIEQFNVTEIIEKAKAVLADQNRISPELKVMFELLLTIISLMAGRLSLSSRNSSKPPSTDPNRGKGNKGTTNNKPGGQLGRTGKNLKPVDNPDNIIPIEVDKSTLPPGNYRAAGFEARQVVDLKISRIITEYRAEVLENDKGKRYVAAFPDGLTRPIQYGKSVKSHAVYLSQYQLIPYERVEDYFVNEIQIPVSVGSLFNFNKEAYDLLEPFAALAKHKLIHGTLIHADETGINVNGKRIWLHNASNELWTYFYPHEKRGSIAMDEIGILPNFNGTLVHDHWKPYYIYARRHGLCNAHHIRELQWVIDNPGFVWAKNMQALLIEMRDAVTTSETNTVVGEAEVMFRERYRQIIKEGQAEMPPTPEKPKNTDGKVKRGRVKKTKELNLLERLRDFENDTLLFMVDPEVPFTNNRGENDIRMTKVQQKISGCFKPMDGAKMFCRIRSYLLTAQKHDVSPTDALQCLFDGKLPAVFFTGESNPAVCY